MITKAHKCIISIILSIAALCISVAALVMCFSLRTHDGKGSSEEHVQYTLFLGTNDKDTNEPVYTQGESKRILREILDGRMADYTIQEAEGGWIGEDGTVYQEYTLVIYVADTTEDEVHALCDELIDRFDQETVLIRMNKASTEYYYGPGN